MSDQSQLRTVLVASSMVLSLVMGVRHGFGFWMQPISTAYQWPREVFSSAMALQNLMWGVLGPFAGMAADRIGVRPVVWFGGACFVAGLLSMAWVSDPLVFTVLTGCLIGAAMACTTFSIMSGIIARSAAREQRTRAFGIAAAMGSLGQFFMMPVEQCLISVSGWQQACLILAAGLVAMIPLAAYFLREPSCPCVEKNTQSMSEALREAFSHPPFWLLLAGYFVCGFQAVFVGVHLPAYLKDHHILNPNVAVMSLALIGLFNIVGSWAAGYLGSFMPKHHLLAGIYAARVLLFGLFLSLPLTPMSVYLFSAGMGVLWLSTVPLTNGIIAAMFGVRYLAMLSGFIFFSHQFGSFLGAWLGGFLYSRYGNYDAMWMIIVALGVLATLVNLPVDETPVARSGCASCR